MTNFDPIFKSVLSGTFIGLLLGCSTALAQSADSDYSLAARFAPMLHLSAPNSEGAQVDLMDGTYLYSDFYPMRVDNLLASPPKATVDLRLKSTVTVGLDDIPPGDYPLDFQGYINLIGLPGVRSAGNSLLFAPLWAGGQRDEQLAYKDRAGTPTVYFRVFRDSSGQNLFPIAVQYWFFYFYNDWFLKHPGDWESVTVFLDGNSNPREIIFATANEANRYSWSNELFEDTRSADHFSVFVSNGGHGSYAVAGETDYSGVLDLHWGDGGTLDFLNGDYALIDLGALEDDPFSWIWFEGRWGNDGVDIPEEEDPAPYGPRFKTDAATGGDWFRAKNRPYDPFNECKRRDYGAAIYDPWYWASGYGLDTPWESPDDCQDASFNIMPPDGIQRAASGNQLFVRWNPVFNASGYKVFIGLNPGVYTDEFDSAGLTTFTENLSDGTYYVALMAFNQFSESAISQEITVTVGQNSSPLSPPANAIVEVEDDRVSISWDAVFGASGYTAQYGLTPGQYVGSLDLGNSTAVAAELAPGTYYVKIAGYGGIDKAPGLFTDELTVFVSEPLSTPTELTPGASTPPIPVVTGSSVALKWNAIEGATYYRLSLRDFTTNTAVFSLNNLATTSFVATGLTRGNSFWWTIQACNNSTCGDASARHYFQTN